MALSFQDRKRLYNACNPEEALSPGDRRNVDLNITSSRSEPVRGTDWVARLGSDFELADAPVLRMFSGLPGSGKSTELRRLAARLQDPQRANLLPVFVDTETLLDLRVSIEVPDLLLVMFYEAERAVLRLESRDPEQALQGGSISRFWAMISRTSVELSKLEAGATVGAGTGKVVFDLKTNHELRERVRVVMKSNRAAFLREIHDAFQDLQNRAIAGGTAGLVLLVDSLEKLRGMSDNFEAVLKSAEQIFAGGAPYLRVPVHCLFTVPPALVLRLSDDIKLLPMIKLRTRQGERFQEGFDAARQIIRLRVPDSALHEIFGPVEAEARVRELIESSGGYPREIVRLLRSILSVESFPLDERELKKLLLEAGDAYRRVALGHGVQAMWILARVHVTKKLFVNDNEREMIDHLVGNNLILRYQNDNEWADVHPALLGVDLFRQAVDRLRAGDLLSTESPALGPALVASLPAPDPRGG